MLIFVIKNTPDKMNIASFLSFNTFDMLQISHEFKVACRFQQPIAHLDFDGNAGGLSKNHLFPTLDTGRRLRLLLIYLFFREYWIMLLLIALAF
jgi:hypothetical protein